MNGTEKIIAHILAQAQQRADGVDTETAALCRSVHEDYEAQAETLYQSRMEAGRRECAERRESMDRMARTEARKGILALKQDMVSSAFEKACDALSRLPKEQYIALLARLAAQAASVGDEEIVLNERDRAAVGGEVVAAANEKLREAGREGRLTLSEAARDMAGGLVLRRGNIEVNCALELLVEMQRGSMAAEVARALFD